MEQNKKICNRCKKSQQQKEYIKQFLTCYNCRDYVKQHKKKNKKTEQTEEQTETQTEEETEQIKNIIEILKNNKIKNINNIINEMKQYI